MAANANWTSINATGVPSVRNYAYVTFDPVNQEILLYGGTNTAGSATYADMYAFNVKSKTWSNLSTTLVLL